MKKTDYKPNYAVHPIETLKELALYGDLGSDWVKRLQREGMSGQDFHLLAALYHVPEQFLRNLQEQYDETKKRLLAEKRGKV